MNLRTADVPQKVKERVEVIKLNPHGWSVEKIAAHFHWAKQTVKRSVIQMVKIWRQRTLELPMSGFKIEVD
ncbi:helix-turn-helix domain-containing protein [Dapis sp. BLCC M126]|uniref:helix-turn-helix domain-containing protein n=1 Tax=Dapis sp. BLCC M126 TaxID=3400189 RepID=UPI003CF4EAB0